MLNSLLYILGADTLDTGSKSLVPDVACQRSCSIDSLRTNGHSRSVSHDSYFDLLQSPLRGGMTTCPSRELSELGLNFDREEPEMRIFSESESLVSSPRVAKDSVQRRVLRARPEDISSTVNSINPSPKKQPRLNLSSPGELKTWATIINEVANENVNSEESSSCKRYKLEDQLSDIQFIDCNTPEHSVTTTLATSANTGYTIYTQIQIHDPPSIYDQQEQHKTIIDTSNTPLRQENERYSYPVTQYTTYSSKTQLSLFTVDGVTTFSGTYNVSEIDLPEKLCSEHIANLVKMRYQLTQSETHGVATLRGISLSSTMLDLVTVSPIQWGKSKEIKKLQGAFKTNF
jgi:hypothetical protein